MLMCWDRIILCENTGLEPVREEAFETEDSYYRIYLYRIMEK